MTCNWWKSGITYNWKGRTSFFMFEYSSFSWDSFKGMYEILTYTYHVLFWDTSVPITDVSQVGNWIKKLIGSIYWPLAFSLLALKGKLRFSHQLVRMQCCKQFFQSVSPPTVFEQIGCKFAENYPGWSSVGSVLRY